MVHTLAPLPSLGPAVPGAGAQGYSQDPQAEGAIATRIFVTVFDSQVAKALPQGRSKCIFRS